jgi:hypothetical protein
VTIAGDTTGTWVGSTNGVGAKIWFSLGAGSGGSNTAGAWVGANSYSATGAVKTGTSFLTQLPKRDIVAIASINVVILFMFQFF